MPNQVPINETAAAAGGYLVPQDLREMIVRPLLRENPVLQMVRTEQINTNRASWPIYLGRPTAAFVGEGAAKGVTGAEYAEMTAQIFKIATNVVYTDEILEDARIDPQVLINQDVAGAFSDLISKNILGVHPGAANTQAFYTGGFDTVASAATSVILNTTQSAEFGTGGDALARAISAAIALVEANGYTANGVLLDWTARAHFRDSRMAAETTAPVYGDGYSRAPEQSPIYGMTPQFTTSMNPSGVAPFTAGTSGGAGSPARVIAVVGDFSQARFILRRDMSLRTSDTAIVGAHNAFEQNKLIARWEMRAGFVVNDRDKAFAKVINAT